MHNSTVRIPIFVICSETGQQVCDHPSLSLLCQFQNLTTHRPSTSPARFLLARYLHPLLQGMAHVRLFFILWFILSLGILMAPIICSQECPKRFRNLASIEKYRKMCSKFAASLTQSACSTGSVSGGKMVSSLEIIQRVRLRACSQVHCL